MRVDLTSPRRSTGVLFSGGVDSVVLAALAADVLSSQFREEKLAAKLELRSQSDSESANLLPTKKLTVPILYLYNVSFGPNPEKSNDRKAALKSYGTLREKYQTISSEHDNQAKIHDTDCKSLNDINHRDEFDDESHDIKIVFRDIVVEWEDICRTESHIRTLLSPKHTVMDIVSPENCTQRLARSPTISLSARNLRICIYSRLGMLLISYIMITSSPVFWSRTLQLLCGLQVEVQQQKM